MQRVALTFVAASLMGISASAAGPDLQVEKRTRDGVSYELYLQSKEPDIQLRAIDVNRGCAPLGGDFSGLSLRFGDKKMVGLYPCDPIEVRLETSMGEAVLSWGEFVSGGLSVQGRNFDNVTLQLIVQSHVPSLQILDVSVNRGNCPVIPFEIDNRAITSPGTLLFGQRTAYTLVQCDLVEANILTTEGMGRFRFD